MDRPASGTHARGDAWIRPARVHLHKDAVKNADEVFADAISPIFCVGDDDSWALTDGDDDSWALTDHEEDETDHDEHGVPGPLAPKETAVVLQQAVKAVRLRTAFHACVLDTCSQSNIRWCQQCKMWLCLLHWKAAHEKLRTHEPRTLAQVVRAVLVGNSQYDAVDALGIIARWNAVQTQTLSHLDQTEMLRFQQDLFDHLGLSESAVAGSSLVGVDSCMAIERQGVWPGESAAFAFATVVQKQLLQKYGEPAQIIKSEFRRIVLALSNSHMGRGNVIERFAEVFRAFSQLKFKAKYYNELFQVRVTVAQVASDTAILGFNALAEYLQTPNIGLTLATETQQLWHTTASSAAAANLPDAPSTVASHPITARRWCIIQTTDGQFVAGGIVDAADGQVSIRARAPSGDGVGRYKDIIVTQSSYRRHWRVKSEVVAIFDKDMKRIAQVCPFHLFRIGHSVGRLFRCVLRWC
jgi:hypothetical protein